MRGRFAGLVTSSYAVAAVPRRGASRRRAVAAFLSVALVAAAVITTGSPAAAATSYTAVQSGAWDDPATWGGVVPAFPASEPPVTATIPAGIAVSIPAGLDVRGAFNVHGAVYNYGFLFVYGALRVGTVRNQRDAELWVLYGYLRAAGDLSNFGKLVNNGGTLQLGEDTTNWDGATFRNDGEMVGDSPYMHFDNYGRFVNVGHVDIQDDAQIVNLGGVIDNDDQYALIELVGGILTNSGYAGRTGVIENNGRIWVHADDDDHFAGTFENNKPIEDVAGGAIIDNYGVIDADGFMYNGRSSDYVIHNRSGAQINVRWSFGISGGRLVNDSGGVIDIVAPGRFGNGAIIETAGVINNGNVLSNYTPGDIRVLCGGAITGNPVLGNAPRDWCDSTPPWMIVPNPIVAEATGPTGAAITYHVDVKDDKDASPVLDCQPPSGATFPLGTTTVSCTATDYVGNVGTASFNIAVVDTTAPRISVLGDPIVVVVQHNAYLDAGATAFDLVDGDVTSRVVVTNPVDINVPASYTVRYDVSDSRGNAASASRAVTVITAAEAVDRLIAEVKALTVAQSVRDDLIRSLLRVSQILHDGRPSTDAGACRLIDVFVDTVHRYLASGALTAQQADGLIARATAIKIGIGCR